MSSVPASIDRKWFLPATVDRAICVRRWAGSETSVVRVARIMLTALPSPPESAGRTDTGTMAVSDWAGTPSS